MKITKVLRLIDGSYCLHRGNKLLCLSDTNKVFGLNSPKRIQVTIADYRMHRSKVVQVCGWSEWWDVERKKTRPLHSRASSYILKLFPNMKGTQTQKVHVSVTVVDEKLQS